MAKFTKIKTSQLGVGKLLEEGAELASPMLKGVYDHSKADAGTDENGEPLHASEQGSLKTLADSTYDTSSAYNALGLSQQQYNADQQELSAVGITQSQTTEILPQLIQMSHSTGQSPSNIITVFAQVYRRNPGDPSRALSIMSTLATYEAKQPGTGVFQMAMQAAEGKNPDAVIKRLNSLRLSNVNWEDVGKKGVALNDGTDLGQAVMGIMNPNSPIRKVTNQLALSNQRRVQQQQALSIDLQTVNAEYLANEKMWEAKQYHNFVMKFPQIASSVVFKTAETAAMMITSVHAVADTISKTLSLGKTKGTLEQGISPNEVSPNVFAPSGRGASNKNNMRKFSALPDAGSDSTGNSENGQLLPDLLKAQQNNSQVSQNTSKINTLNTALGAIMDTCEKTYSQLTTLMGQSIAENNDTSERGLLGNPTEFSASVVDPAQISQVAGTLGNSSLQAENIANQLIQLNQNNVQTSIQTNNIYKQNNITNLNSTKVKILNYKIYATNLSVFGPLYQKIQNIEYKRKLAEAHMNQDTSGLVGIGTYTDANGVTRDSFTDVVSMYQQEAQLHQQAANLYGNVRSLVKNEPGFVQFASNMMNKHLTKATQLQTEGKRLMTSVMGFGTDPSGKSTGGITSLSTSKNGKFTRFADQELEDYYDNLYKNSPGSPGFGTALEHPETYEGVPTTHIHPNHKTKKLRFVIKKITKKKI